MDQFIKYIKLDEDKRIIVAAQSQFQSYLAVEKNRQFLMKMTKDLLGDEFNKLEIGKTSCRITVKEGTEERNLKRVEKELINGLEMAMMFLKKMGK